MSREQVRVLRSRAGVEDVEGVATGAAVDKDVSHATGRPGCVDPVNRRRRQSGEVTVSVTIVVQGGVPGRGVCTVVQVKRGCARAVNVDPTVDARECAALVRRTTADGDIVAATRVIDVEESGIALDAHRVIAGAGIERRGDGGGTRVGDVVRIAARSSEQLHGIHAALTQVGGVVVDPLDGGGSDPRERAVAVRRGPGLRVSAVVQGQARRAHSGLITHGDAATDVGQRSPRAGARLPMLTVTLSLAPSMVSDPGAA